MGECPVAAFGDAGAGCGGGDVGVDPDSAQLIRRPEAVAGGAGGEPTNLSDMLSSASWVTPVPTSSDCPTTRTSAP